MLDYQSAETGYFDIFDRREHPGGQFSTLFRRKRRVFTGAPGNGYNNPIKQPGRLDYYIAMAVGNGIKGTGINSGYFHCLFFSLT